MRTQDIPFSDRTIPIFPNTQKSAWSRKQEFSAGCIRLENPSKEYSYYAIYDTPSRLSAGLLAENRVSAEIIREISAYHSPYDLLLYKCWSGEAEQFEAAVTGMAEKMQEKGYVDYLLRWEEEVEQHCLTINALAGYKRNRRSPHCLWCG